MLNNFTLFYALSDYFYYFRYFQVEEEVQQLWRTAYRLTKLFAHPDMRGPMRAAASIKGKLEKFKINMPLINALCNPGIKDRHWSKMSEKVKRKNAEEFYCYYLN